MRYFQVWFRGDRDDPSLAFVRNAPNGLGLHDYCMRAGVRIGEHYPKELKVHLDPRSPGIKLSSLLGNVLAYLMVNTAMKDTILEVCTNEIEVLPFTLYNHKKRVHSKDYWIINPIGTFDCVNRDASTIVYAQTPKREILGVEQLVFDPDRMEGAPDLFRVPEEPANQYASERLGKVLQQRGFTNVLLREMKMKSAKGR